jgi:hypothetical protein
MKKWIRLNICLTPEEYQAFRVCAATLGVPMSHLARGILKAKLNEWDKAKAAKSS